MKIYLAARYSRYKEMQKYRDDLQKLGHTVTSRWINGDHQAENDELEKMMGFAVDDWKDIKNADCVISFTEKPRVASTSRGGRHAEHGIALGLNKEVIVIGHRENVFHCLPQVEFYETWEDFIKAAK